MRKYFWSVIVCLLSLAVCAHSQLAVADQLDIGGKLEQILNYDPDTGDYSTAATDYTVYLEKEFGLQGELFISFAGTYDMLQERSSIELDEAYTSVYLRNIDLTMGKQVINWGTADGINPTNSINPVNLASFTGEELKGESVLAAQGTYYGSNLFLTGVIVFDFLPQDLSSIGENGELNFTEPVIEPETKPENMEYAIKVEKNIGGYDFKLSYFHGWEDLPVLKATIDIDPTTFQPLPGYLIEGEYRWMDKIGLSMAGTLNQVGIWGEAALSKPEEIIVENNDPLKKSFLLSPNEPYIQAVIGSDYTLDNGISVEGQYIYYGNGSLVNPYLQPGENIEAEQYLMGHLAYTFAGKHTIELTSLTNIKDYSTLVLPVYTHQLTQAVKLKVKPIFVFGKEGEDLTVVPEQYNITIETSF